MFLGRALLEAVATGCEPVDRASALVELGRLEEAEEELNRAGEAGRDVEWAEVRARIQAARGDFLAALAGLAEVAPEAPGAVLEQARLLGLLGHFDEAIALLDGSSEPSARLVLAGLHLEAGESAPASLLIPAEDAGPPATPAAGDRASLARAWLTRCEIELLRGELLFQGKDAAAALAPLRRARSLAGRCGSPTAIAVASARVGEAHAHALNPWRALRAVTRAMDLAAAGRVHRGALPGIHYRAFVVYRGCGHEALAASALQSGHHIVLQLASGIDDRAYRETFLLDNRDCQRLVGAWKGESGWGSDVPRG
jgi:tetratricopeptide (TPR) repeat protein